MGQTRGILTAFPGITFEDHLGGWNVTKKEKPTKIKRIPIPELGMDVFVRRIGKEERDTFEAAIIESRDENGNFFYKWIPGRIEGLLLARAIVDEDGNRVYSDEEAGKLGAGHSDAKYRIYREALYINGLGPKPDHGKDRVVAPSWLKNQFPDFAATVERFPMLFPNFGNNPTNVFKKKYAEKYRHGTEARDHLLGTVPSVPETEQADALDRLLDRHPKPIHYGRWKKVEGYVMRNLVDDAKSEGKSLEEVMKERLLRSLAVGAVTARRKTGMFTTEEELTLKFKAAYRSEAETDLRIPKKTDAFSYLKMERLSDDPEDAEEFDPVEDEELTATGVELHQAALADRLDVWKRFERLSPENKKTIQVLFENGQDYRKTAKALKITEVALRQRLSKMKKAPLRRCKPP